ncbi:MAG: SH3 domain-containing protein [Spirochaetia bacterium]
MYRVQNTFTRYFLLLLGVTISALFSACSGGNLGYGVVLFSPDTNALETGAVVVVKYKSDISNTYKVEPPDSDQSFEIDTWRVELFEKRKEAQAQASEYDEYENIFARNMRDGLAIREEPDISSNRVYKLRVNQEIKVLGKTDVEEEIGGHDGVWYRVLTKDGVQGYSFDYYLKLFDITAAPEEQAGPDLTPIKEALARSYRPEDFKAMEENQQIDLQKFSTEYGIFTDLEKQTIDIRLYKKSYTFEYDEIKRMSDRRYAFVPADLEIIIRDEDSVQAVYTIDDRTYDPVFEYYAEDDIREIREAEQERRDELYTQLLESGPVFTSNAYGEIEFEEGREFSWRNLDRLVPSIIPGVTYESGSVSLDHFLARSISSEYTGALAFRFEQASNEPLIFLYSLEGNALKLEYVPARYVDEKVLRERSSSRLIMAFFGQTAD